MSFLAARLARARISASATSAQRTRELRAAGHDIIGLSQGEPDFDTPEHVVEAAYRAMRAGQTRYTPVDGTPELKQAIVAKFRSENGLAFQAENISAGAGGKQVLYNALMATLDPGDAVLIPAPSWVAYAYMTEFAEGVPVWIATRAENGFKLTPEELEGAITPRAKWLMLNSPSNPTGAVYSADELRALAAVLERHPQIWIIADDIYEHIVFDGRAFATLAEVAPQLAERTLTVNGVSKTYSMTGWRLGFGAGPATLIRGHGAHPGTKLPQPFLDQPGCRCCRAERPAGYRQRAPRRIRGAPERDRAASGRRSRASAAARRKVLFMCTSAARAGWVGAHRRDSASPMTRTSPPICSNQALPCPMAQAMVFRRTFDFRLRRRS
jgi:histidinol-phosphate/aromatic aminotransferase/cobyric acid decarboxylase-like protein